MEDRMDRAYLEQYRTQGYAVVKGVLAPTEVRELEDAFDHVYRQGLRHPRSFRHQNVLFRIAEDPRLGRIVRMVQWPAYFDPVLARYRTDPRMLAMLEPLLGRDLKQIINQMHWKPPGAAGVEFGYHQDIRFRRPREAYREPAISYVQTGIAIDPHRPENGAMTVLPGSHELGELGFEGAGRVMDRQLSDDDLRALGLDPAAKVDLVLDPGDVALWHLNLIHGSGPNRSAGDRRFYLNGYVIAKNCDRGEWAFRKGEPCALGEPVLVHYEDLHSRPEPHYLET
jgi:ectoine hydroxylase-related dioxygenase (phytanoyl-CoA dioxygenase family)